MFSDHTAQGILGHITGQAGIFTEPTAYVALFTVAPTADSGTGATEVSTSGTGYARAVTSSTSWNPPSGSGPSSITNSTAISYSTAIGSGFGTVVAFGLYDASTGGNLLAWDWLGNYAWQPVEIGTGTDAPFTVGQTAYAASTAVVLDTANRFGGISPTYSTGAPTTNVVLTVTSTGVSANVFYLGNGTTHISVSAYGSSMVRQVTQQAIPAGVTPSFAAGALTLTAS